MVVKLHGFPISTCTRRALVALLEKDVPYEFVQINPLTETTKTREYKENMQPFSQVPILEDDGLFIYESRAIARYIATKYAETGTPDLVPSLDNLSDLAAFEQACSIEYSQFNPAAEGLITEKLIKKVKGLPSNDVLADEWTTQLAQKMDSYEIILSKKRYLAGDHVTLADLFHLPYGFVLTTLLQNDALDGVHRPNVARWWADISARKSWRTLTDEKAVEMEKAIYKQLLEAQPESA